MESTERDTLKTDDMKKNCFNCHKWKTIQNTKHIQSLPSWHETMTLKRFAKETYITITNDNLGEEEDEKKKWDRRCYS